MHPFFILSRGLNRRPSDPQVDAQPTKLRPWLKGFMVIGIAKQILFVVKNPQALS